MLTITETLKAVGFGIACAVLGAAVALALAAQPDGVTIGRGEVALWALISGGAGAVLAALFVASRRLVAAARR